jgi:hypothetical protein
LTRKKANWTILLGMGEEPIDRVAELKRLRDVAEQMVADLEASRAPDPEKLDAARAMLERIRDALRIALP